jgi:hypothetical protein
VAFTFRGRGRPGPNRVPASTLVRRGIVEAGIYAVRVVSVRGERRQEVGEVVVAMGRRQVRRLPTSRHTCDAAAARGLLAALPSALGGGTPFSGPGEQGGSAGAGAGSPASSGGVAAAPGIELPPQIPPLAEAPGPPGALVYGAVLLVLLALGGIAVSVARTLRGQ